MHRVHVSYWTACTTAQNYSTTATTKTTTTASTTTTTTTTSTNIMPAINEDTVPSHQSRVSCWTTCCVTQQQLLLQQQLHLALE